MFRTAIGFLLNSSIMEDISAICQDHCWRQKTSASVCGHVVPATSESFLSPFPKRWQATTTLDKEEFRLLFEPALEIAAENAEKQAGRPLPRSLKIEVHGVGPHPKIMEKNEVVHLNCHDRRSIPHGGVRCISGAGHRICVEM
jgi:hypothetical protein